MIKFELNEKEEKKYLKFREKKKKKLKNQADALTYTFCFTPTGIGDCIFIKSSDGDEKDITDYDSW